MGYILSLIVPNCQAFYYNYSIFLWATIFPPFLENRLESEFRSFCTPFCPEWGMYLKEGTDAVYKAVKDRIKILNSVGKAS